MKRKIDLSIVLPVFNEEKNIPRVVEEFRKVSEKISLEILFVEDGGSKDNTRKVIGDFSKKYAFVRGVFTGEPGYGISLYNGLKKARGEFIGWTHSDLQTPPIDVLKAFDLIKKQENPLNVYIKGKRYGRPLADKLVNTIGMSIFETLVLGKFMYEINAQPNIFHKSFLEKLRNPPRDFAFDLYAYYMAKKCGYEMIRFPVFFGKRIYGESAWNSGWKARIKFIRRTLNFTFKLKKSL